MLTERTAGILLHPTSLPGPFGSGDLGASGRFLDLLGEMRLSWWQMLPVGPTGYGNSPYQSPSTFAGNPLLVDPARLVADGLLEPGALEIDPLPDDHVDFGRVIAVRMGILEEAAHRFEKASPAAALDAFDRFRNVHGDVWLDDFALFTAIKRHSQERPWWEWDRNLALRDPAALEEFRLVHGDAVRRVEIEQFFFDTQMSAVRSEANRRGVGLIGDIPIFVAHDSADVWGNRQLFHLDEDGMPTVVAGVPPDYFSKTGQRWGNPLYDWDAHRATGFAWWVSRMRRVLDLFDLVRIDHFRGFAASWHIPASEPTAVEGEWIEAPGEELFDTLLEQLGSLDVIAEDLGLITPDVEELRDRYHLPGMKVLQFGFGTETAHSLDKFGENVVAYTGTHDNDTARGWFESRADEAPDELEIAVETLGSTAETFAHDLIEAVMRTAANTTIFPLQDLLGLGTDARMNEPGTTAGNWTWRFEWEQVGPDIVDWIAGLVIETGRG